MAQVEERGMSGLEDIGAGVEDIEVVGGFIQGTGDI